MLLIILFTLILLMSLGEASTLNVYSAEDTVSPFKQSIINKNECMNTNCIHVGYIVPLDDPTCEYSTYSIFIHNRKYPPSWKTSGSSIFPTQVFNVSCGFFINNEKESQQIKVNNMARPSQLIILSDADKEELSEILASSKEGSGIYKRAYTILELSRGVKPSEIADALHISESRCSEYKHRFLKNGIQGLYDAPHTPFSPSLESELLSLWNEHGGEWSIKEYANVLHCSISSVKLSMKKLGIDIQLSYKDVNIKCTPQNIDERPHGPKLRITVEIIDEEDKCVSKVSKEGKLNSVNILNETQDYKDFGRAINDIEMTFFKTMTNATTDSFDEALNYKKKEDRTRSVKVISRFGNFNISAPTWINKHLAPNEYYMTSDIKQLIIQTMTSTSYNKGCAILNSALARKEDDELKVTTIEHFISREGNLLRDNQLMYAQKIVEENNSAIPVPERRDLSANSHSKKKQTNSEDSIKSKNNTEPNKEKCKVNDKNFENIIKDDPNTTNERDYESFYGNGDTDSFAGNELILKGIEFIKNHNKNDPDLQIGFNVINEIELNLEKTNYLHLDDVCVPHQNDKRCVNGNESSKISKRVYHSNVLIKTPQGRYSITADNIQSAAYMSFAFLAKNGLFSNHKLVCFTDGAKPIRDTIKDYFIPLKGVYHRTWLDWYHAKKKTNELLSLSLVNGGKKKEETERIKKENARIKASVLHHIWYGDVDGAIKIIKEIPEDRVKDKGRAEQLILYFNERRENICCYALRRALGLPNSSNPVETMNFTLVANRQKGNGMSWGHKGSYALAIFQALIENDELNSWLNEDLTFFKPYKTSTEKHLASNKGKSKAV